MSESESSKIRLDVPTGVRAGILAGTIAIGLVVLLNMFDVSRVSFMVAPILQLTAGMFYVRRIFSKIDVSYLEGAAGGAVAGAITGFIIIIGGTLVSGLLVGSNFEYAGGLSSFSEDTFTGDFLNSMVVGAALGAIGGLWVILMRTQRID
jgi:hypothetical protein